MSPGNILGGNAYGGGQALALRRTRGVVTADDGLNQFGIQSRGSDELFGADAGLFHVACQRFHERNLITPPMTRTETKREGTTKGTRCTKRISSFVPFVPFVVPSPKSLHKSQLERIHS